MVSKWSKNLRQQKQRSLNFNLQGVKLEKPEIPDLKLLKHHVKPIIIEPIPQEEYKPFTLKVSFKRWTKQDPDLNPDLVSEPDPHLVISEDNMFKDL